jgi:hypothetical protein
MVRKKDMKTYNLQTLHPKALAGILELVRRGTWQIDNIIYEDEFFDGVTTKFTIELHEHGQEMEGSRSHKTK